MLKIKFLSKNYGSVEALKEINFGVKNREFIALVGPSGCGKSTLLECISGLLSPTYGEVILDRVRITEPSRRIGMVFQDFSLFPWLTARENIDFGLKIKNLSKTEREKIVNHYLNATNLQDFAEAYTKSLSGGMKQRVAIARTLANDPKVILMDEPFGSLDNLTRFSMQEFLTDLWERDHKTILFVTHDIEEAIFLADRIIVLSERPARILKIFDVPFKRPRKHKIKSSHKFFSLRNKIAAHFE